MRTRTVYELNVYGQNGGFSIIRLLPNELHFITKILASGDKIVKVTRKQYNAAKFKMYFG